MAEIMTPSIEKHQHALIESTGCGGAVLVDGAPSPMAAARVATAISIGGPDGILTLYSIAAKPPPQAWDHNQ